MTRWLLLCAAGALLGASQSDDEVTYREHVAPIIARRCLPCHNPGEAGAFPLTTYDEVRRRASLIRWVVLAGSMPPTKVESDNHPMTGGYLADEEKVTIQEWVRTGLKEGSGPERAVAPTSASWRIDRPDRLLKPREQTTVAAEGAPYRRLFVLDPELTTPTQLKAFNLRPLAPFAVRHAWVAVIRKGDEDFAETRIFRREGLDTKAMVGAWAPGYPHWQSTSGIPLQPGDRLAVAVLYQPTGRSEPAGFELGVTLGEPASAQASWVRLGRAEGTLAPGDGIQTLHDELLLEEDRSLRGFIPECREFARQVRVLAVAPSGKRDTLLRINSWDVNWMGAYQWAKSVPLKKGTRLRVEIDYDNSGHSAGGRELLPIDPVKFGPGMGEELFWVHVQFD